MDTDARCAMRSVDCMLNETAETCPTMNPDETASDAVSADVATVTLTEPAVALPMTKPDSVTTNAEAETA